MNDLLVRLSRYLHWDLRAEKANKKIHRVNDLGIEKLKNIQDPDDLSNIHARVNTKIDRLKSVGRIVRFFFGGYIQKRISVLEGVNAKVIDQIQSLYDRKLIVESTRAWKLMQVIKLEKNAQFNIEKRPLAVSAYFTTANPTDSKAVDSYIRNLEKLPFYNEIIELEEELRGFDISFSPDAVVQELKDYDEQIVFPKEIQKLFLEEFNDLSMVEKYIKRLQYCKEILLLTEATYWTVIPPKELSQLFYDPNFNQFEKLDLFKRRLELCREILQLETEKIKIPDNLNEIFEEVDFKDFESITSEIKKLKLRENQDLQSIEEILLFEEAASIQERPKNIEVDAYMNQLRELIKSRIKRLEKEAGLEVKPGQTLPRPSEVVKLFKDEKVNPRAILLHIQNLKEKKRVDVGVVGEEVDITSAVTLAHEPTIIQMVSKTGRGILGSGSYGVAEKQEGLSQGKSGFTKRTYVSKGDIVGDTREITGETRREYFKMKALRESVEREFPEDVDYILSVITSHQQKAPTYFRHVTKLYEKGSLEKLWPSSREKKQIGKSLLRSLSLFLKLGFVLSDMAPRNIFCRNVEDGSIRAVFGDLGALVNFQKIIDHPTKMNIKLALKDIGVWPLYYIPGGELLEVIKQLRVIDKEFDTSSKNQIRQKLKDILTKIRVFTNV